MWCKSRFVPFPKLHFLKEINDFQLGETATINTDKPNAFLMDFRDVSGKGIKVYINDSFYKDLGHGISTTPETAFPQGEYMILNFAKSDQGTLINVMFYNMILRLFRKCIQKYT